MTHNKLYLYVTYNHILNEINSMLPGELKIYKFTVDSVDKNGIRLLEFDGDKASGIVIHYHKSSQDNYNYPFE